MTKRADTLPLDRLISQLRRSGHAAPAQRLDLVLHHQAYTTGSELIASFGTALLEERSRIPEPLPEELDRAFRAALREVRKVWPSLR